MYDYFGVLYCGSSLKKVTCYLQRRDSLKDFISLVIRINPLHVWCRFALQICILLVCRNPTKPCNYIIVLCGYNNKKEICYSYKQPLYKCFKYNRLNYRTHTGFVFKRHWQKWNIYILRYLFKPLMRIALLVTTFMKGFTNFLPAASGMVRRWLTFISFPWDLLLPFFLFDLSTTKTRFKTNF